MILISIDTLRADHLSLYGDRRDATPHIDSFAEHGTVFTKVDSQIPLTLPSHTSLFTSTYPFQNHIQENAEIVPSSLITLASVLRNHGYATGAFIGSDLLSRRYGLNRGFDIYDDPFHSQAGKSEGPYSVRVRRDGALVTRSALNWLASQQAHSVFAFVHLFDLHTPYALRQFSGARLLPNAAGYSAEIQYVDQVLGHFKDALVRSGWWQRSVVIVLSDHGESLGEHGETSHGYFVYESTLHVPVIVHWPESVTEYPHEVSEPAGLIDIAPTVLKFLHLAPPASFKGVDLLARAPSGERQVFSETTYAHDAFHWAALHRLRVANFAYIDAPRAELYDLHSDPAERNNILPAQAPTVRKLKEQLIALLTRYSNQQPEAAADTSPQSLATLRSLGYLAGGAASRDLRSGPDPKDRLPEYQAYEKAMAALYSDHENLAASQFHAILLKNPDNTLARYYLGEAYAKLGRPDDAVREWRTAIARDHTYAPAAIAIGELYLVQGFPAKARDAFEEAVLISPNDYESQFKLGIAEQQLGLFEQAKRHVEAACKLVNDDSGDCQRSIKQLEQKLR